MKKIIGFLIIAFACFQSFREATPPIWHANKLNIRIPFPAALMVGTTWYIDPTGNDGSGTGAIGAPWASLNKAVDNVSTPTDVIHINAGSYTETKIDTLAPGVSIEGADTSLVFITSTYSSTANSAAAIRLLSSSDGTDGAQHITGITLDGNSLAAKQGIIVFGRSNVKIHNIVIKNFARTGIWFKGSANTAKPSPSATGNEFYNFRLYNNADRNEAAPGGNIIATGYHGFLLHDGIIDQRARAAGHNGDNYSASTDGWADGLEAYNITSYRNMDEGGVNFSFHFEMWSSQGNMYWHDCTFYNGYSAIDMEGFTDSLGINRVKNCRFITPGQIPSTISQQGIAVNIEGDSRGILIDSNYFQGFPYMVQMTLHHTHLLGQHNITIRYNIADSMGYANGDYSHIISIGNTNDSSVISNVFVYNNDLRGHGSRSGMFIDMATGSQAHNIQFINNSVTNIQTYGYFTFGFSSGGFEDSINVSNNLSNNNSNGNNIYVGSATPTPTTPTNYVHTGQVAGAPLYVSATDFHLTAGSPGIDKGKDVGLPFTGAFPDVGAYEYISPNPYMKIYGNHKFKNF